MAEKILFFFSALGVFNALLLGTYLFFFKSNHSLENRFYSLLLSLLVIRVGVSCFHFFETVPYGAIKLGLIANFLLGPTMLFAMKSSIDSSKETVKQSVLQYSFWIVILTLAWFLFDFSTWNWRIRYIVHSALAAYLIYIIANWRISFFLFLKSEILPFNTKNAIVIYFAVVLICIGFAVSLFTSYILGPLTFSIVFYLLIVYFLVSDRKQKNQVLSKKISQEEFNRLNQRLIDLMEKEKPYRDPGISLESLAGQLSISRHLLSQLLNENLDKNFYQYINSYRIQEACIMLRENKKFSIEAIGYEVGFNSRSSFFSSFKKLKGTTPSKYREEVASV